MYYFSSKMVKKAVFLSFFSQSLSVYYKNWMHFLKNIFFLQKNSFHLEIIFALFLRFRSFKLRFFKAAPDWLRNVPRFPLFISTPNKNAFHSAAAELYHRISSYIWIERLFENSIWAQPAPAAAEIPFIQSPSAGENCRALKTPEPCRRISPA